MPDFCKNCGKKRDESEKFCSNCSSVTPEKGSHEINNFEQQNTTMDDKKLKGLSGWLTIVGLGLLVTIVYGVSQVYSFIKMFSDGSADLVANPNSITYISGYGLLLKFELVIQFALLVGGIYLTYLFLKKKKEFPKFYVIFLVVSALFVLFDYVCVSSLNVSTPEFKKIIDDILTKSSSDLGRAFFGAIIWGSYMNKSKRVKLTFIE